MNSNNSFDDQSQLKKSEFDSFFITAMLFRFRFLLIGIFLGSAIISSAISLYLPNQYTATVNAVPSNTKGGSISDAIGGLSSTLKEFGLSKFGQKSGTYDFIVILFSRSFQDSIIEKYNLFQRYDIPDTSRTLMYEELKERIDISFEKEGNYTISYIDENPDTAAQIANYSVGLANNIYKKIFQEEASISSNFIENRIKSIDSSLVGLKDSMAVYSKKYMIFSPDEQAGSISKAFTELKYELMKQEVILEILKSKYGDKDQNTKSQAEIVNSLKNKVNQSTFEPGFAGNFPMTDVAEVGMEYIRLYSEIEVFSKLKGFLMPMLEESRLDEQKNIQSLLVVDRAIPPDKKSGPKRSLIVAGASFGMLILTILALILWFNYKAFLVKFRNFKSQTDLQ